MIELRKGSERQHERRRNQEAWLTPGPLDRAERSGGGPGPLERLSEDRLPPGVSLPRRSPHDAEIITYVREGTLAYEDSTGRSGMILAGEFHRMTGAEGVRHSERNASRSEWAHVFQICLRSAGSGVMPGHEQRRFSAAERRGRLRVVASSDARGGSLRIHRDVVVGSAILFPGQHLVHELPPGRSAWLHVVMGEVALGDVLLAMGDGVGVTAQPAVSLTARWESEILLVEVGDGPAASPGGGPAP